MIYFSILKPSQSEFFLGVRAGADPGFVRPEAHKISRNHLKKRNTKLDTEVNIYLE
jgi:hypothetical protein